jgi:hypothetical protein
MNEIMSRQVCRRSHRFFGSLCPSGVNVSHRNGRPDLFQNLENTVNQDKAAWRFIPVKHLK